MNKRILCALFSTAVVSALALPALAQDATPESTVSMAPWVCPTGYEGQTLNIYNWGTYMSNEDNPDTADVNENLLQNFEQLCGVTVIYEDTMESSEALVARLRGGNPGYDLAVPTGYVVPVLVEDGLLEPLDLTRIPNAAHVSEFLADPWYDPGNLYSVPYFWGTIAIGYNRARTNMDVTSWAQLFEYNGPVSWLEDRRAMLGTALLLLGFDPNTENLDEIAQARDYLIANSSNVVTIAQDDGQVLLERGDVDMTVEYNGDIFQIAATCAENPNCTDDFAYSVPEEGASFWVDNMVIPAGAPNPELAMVFMDYMYDPHISAINANFVQFGSPNQASIDNVLIDQELLDNPGIYPPAEVTARLFEIYDLPDTEVSYSDAWEEVKLNLGG